MPDKSNQLVPLDASSQPGGCKKPLFGLDAEALAACMVEIGEPAWRGNQLAEAIYRQRVSDISEITTLPKALRQRLAAEGWQIARPAIARAFQSVDGTERYLIEFGGSAPNGQTVEAVWMPEGDGGEAGDENETGESHDLGAPGPDSGTRESTIRNLRARRADKIWSRATICVSSQVGCAVNCQFCLTAKLGLQRNLTAGEIAGQVVAVLDRHAVRVGRDRVNLVFMGMGEPFLNYDNFMAAVRLLVREVGLSPQRMTVSTSGIVPGIERFAQEPPDLRPKLAISLNAPNDHIRAEVMPINRKWPIAAVIDAVRRVPLRPARAHHLRICLAGRRHRPSRARPRGRPPRAPRRTTGQSQSDCLEPGPGIEYTTPEPGAVEAFQNTLAAEGIPAYVRQPRGRDIFAACGQLKRTVEG